MPRDTNAASSLCTAPKIVVFIPPRDANADYFTVSVQIQYTYRTVLYFVFFFCPFVRRQCRLPLPPRNITVVILIDAAYQRTFNNRELFLLLFTTNLFGLAIQRRVSSKQVVPARKKQREQGKTKE